MYIVLRGVKRMWYSCKREYKAGVCFNVDGLGKVMSTHCRTSCKQQHQYQTVAHAKLYGDRPFAADNGMGLPAAELA